MIAEQNVVNNLQVRNLHKRFHGQQGEVVALRDINLSIRVGEFVSIVGSSGWKIIPVDLPRPRDRGSFDFTRKWNEVYQEFFASAENIPEYAI